MTATPQRPFSQYRRPEPVETLTTRQTCPPRRIVIFCRAMLTSILTAPVALGFVATPAVGFRGFLVTGGAGVVGTGATVVGAMVVGASVAGTVVTVVGGAVVAAVVGGVVVGGVVAVVGGTISGGIEPESVCAPDGRAMAPLRTIATTVATPANVRNEFRGDDDKWLGFVVGASDGVPS